ncbi:type II toxin-antitoxin system Phd/YefM family antitoxin [Humibacter albus]|jgi:antitoxin (DNA-binding transcriptional repressor) of toxin-antitoxin stability system|uniref:type II toxin-antitoxin system Phd/YefM family antitoxin n=1 Tax=Humibacter albus TaxID=427754 RepID=UPI00047E60E8|nr:prevent-host-death protein [Humibacter albus]
MSFPSEVSQRDLRLRSREIMDAVEHGASFTVTRDGHGIGELVPLRRSSRFVSRDEFLALGAGLGPIDTSTMRDDLDLALKNTADDPYER